MFSKSFLLLLVVFLSSSPLVQAGMIKMSFSGSVTSSESTFNTLDDPLDNYISVGEIVTGFFIYDPFSVFTSNSGPSNSRYDNAISAFSLSLSSGFTAASSRADLQVLDGSGGQDVVTIDSYASEGLMSPDIGSNIVSVITLDFRDADGSSFVGSGLPSPALNLASFIDQTHGIRVNGVSSSGGEAHGVIRFEIDSITSTELPIPSTLFLSMLGLFLLRRTPMRTSTI